MKTKRYLFKGLIALLMVSMLNCSLVAYATENEDETTEGNTDTTIIEENYGWEPDPFERLEIGFDSNVVGLTSKYDPRDYDYLTDERDQYPHELCWMYGTVGATEMFVSKNYGSKFDVSEVHGAVAMSKSIIPSNSNGKGYFTNKSDAGASFSRAFQYLTNWNTPIFNEQTCSWQSTVSEETYPKSKLLRGSTGVIDDSFTNAESLFNVTGAKFINKSQDTIKYAIKNYGAVITDICFGMSLLNGDSNGDANFYTGSDPASPNHCIIIVGWDDNYSKENFIGSEKPTTDGAWLVRNSWSNSNYIWVPYQEGSFLHSNCRMAAITGIQKSTDNEYMLSYDYLLVGSSEEEHFNDNVYLCNTFDVSGLTDDYEKITKVMMFLKTSGCTYNVKIAQLDENNNLPTNLNTYSTLATGTYVGEGYLTVDLNQDFIFTSNNRCAVIVELIPLYINSEIYIPTEISTDQTNVGESYFGFADNANNITWTDCKSNHNLKAKGNHGIRPILQKRVDSTHNVVVTPTVIEDNGTDATVQIDSDSNLFNIHTLSNEILVENMDYIRTDTGITITNEFINSLNGNYTELILEFNNDITKTVVVNPKATITDVTITGSPILGDTITASCVGVPEKDEYDVTYQWQSSLQGTNWYDIAGATSSSYTVSENVYGMYLRVKVTSELFGNVVYPATYYSDSTQCKVVILGDVDNDGSVSIADCTKLQKYLNGSGTLSNEQRLAADADRDGFISISDVTKIQKMLVS